MFVLSYNDNLFCQVLKFQNDPTWGHDRTTMTQEQKSLWYGLFGICLLNALHFYKLEQPLIEYFKF